MGTVVIYSQNRLTATLIAEVIADQAQVIVCSSAEDVEQQCARHRPDVVVITAIAPLLNGSNIIRSIRPTGERRPTIFVVAWHQSEHIVLCLLESGVDQYMTFPISIGRLENKLRAYMNTESNFSK